MPANKTVRQNDSASRDALSEPGLDLSNINRKPELSVVLPLYNEVENIRPLHAELIDVLQSMNRPFEVIFVDDGSTDGSFEELKRMYQENPTLRVIRLRRNFGQTAAFMAGFDAARSEWIVTMDADLQNDPADIPRLMAKAVDGFDVVSGWRTQRHDSFLSRKLPSRLANWLIARVTGVKLHDYGCSLKVYHRDILKNVRLYGELHRFIPAAASGGGISVAELAVRHRARERGQSKYASWRKTLKRTFNVFLDLLTVRFLLSYSTRPSHLFGGIGLMTVTAGSLLAFYLSYQKFFLGQDIGGRPLLVLAVLLIVVGAQFITTGLLGELVVRTYHEVQDKPIYIVRESLGS